MGCDCIDREEPGNAVCQRRGGVKARSTNETSEHSITRDLVKARAQGYRIKRISACGGCLGDYRR